jgi:ABC-type multidrug transport system fused ATPase/permease subunit
MFETLKQIKKLLDRKHKSYFLLLQILNIFSAIIEISALGLLAIFASIINDFSFIVKIPIIEQIYQKFFLDKKSFLLSLGFLVALFYFVASISSIYMNWCVAKFTTKLSNFFSNKLYNYYIESNWLYFVNFDPMTVTNNIITNLKQITERVFQSYLNISHKLVIAISISITVFVFNKEVALIGITIFSLIYYTMFLFIKKIIEKQTKKQLSLIKDQHQLINKSFNAMKEVIIFNLQSVLKKKYQDINSENFYPQTIVRSINQLPRLLIEMISYIIVICSIIIFIYINNDYQSLLPLIAMYAFAGLKLLPAFQQIYLAVVNIRVGKISFDLIKSDLFKSLKNKFQKKNDKVISFKKTIDLKNINFSYNKNSKILNNVNLRIKKNTIIGIVGQSGSGKSTLVDLILGLLKPDNGEILIDDKPLNKYNIREWQNTTSFVSQFPYFINSSIKDNISFLSDKKKENKTLLAQSIKNSELSNLLNKRKKGIDTKIGDKGVRFSGGEKQRIAIARALYRNSSFLILDEATSSMDVITEQKILNNIKNNYLQKTIIIISHRVKSLKICNKIFVLNKGSIFEEGTYSQLLKKNSLFSKLASEFI